MWKNILKITLRNLGRHRLHSLVVVVSLTVGMACFVLFYLSWQYERSFDRYHPGADRIYRVNRSIEVSPGRPMVADQVAAMAPALAREFPEVEAATRWYVFPEAAIGLAGGDLRPAASVYAVDGQFFKVFAGRVLAGDDDRALADSSSVLISRRTARAVFGSEEALGKSIRLAVRDRALMRARFEREQAEGPVWDARNYTVAAILPDPPSNSTYAFDILIPIEAAARLYEEADFKAILDQWGFGWTTTFVRLRRGTALSDLESKIDALKAGRTPPPASGETTMKERTLLVPLTGLHLSDAALAKYLYIFGTIATVVLLLACFNAINLTTARVLSRFKEIGLKKVVGAGRRDLVVQFLAESFVASAIALALALAAVVSFLPLFRNLSGRGLVLGEIGIVPLIGGLAAIVFFAAAASGGYPAYVLSAVRPVDLFAKDRTPLSFRSFVRKGLVFAQFAISGVLLTMALTVTRQMAFIGKADLGMDIDGIVVLRREAMAMVVAGERDRGANSLDLLKADLLGHSGILGATAISEVPPGIEAELDVKPGGLADSEKTPWRYLTADYGFLDAFGIRLAEGRYFSKDFPSDRKNAAVINETAARLLGPGKAVGKQVQAIIQKGVTIRLDYTVVGVVKDFHTRPLRDAMEPLLILPGEAMTAGTLAVKTRPGRETDAARFMRERWAAVFPDVPASFTYLEDDVRRAYGAEERLMSMTRIFASVAIFIGCIGLFGLVAFATARRRREIGIRKVLGASPARLFGAFAKEFITPVFLSNLAAWPAAFFLAQSWLREFAYRATLPAWIFLAGATAVLLFALLAIGGHLLRAARENPAETLRQE